MLFLFDYKPYIAVIGDMKNSKQLKDRNAVQKQLQNLLDTINLVYAADIASKFMITLGDEFQGLLKSGASVVYIIDRIERAMYPVKLRFGIGVGEITTDIQSAMPLGADGPAYYHAREMIKSIKSSEKEKKESKKTIEIKIHGNEKMSELLNTVFHLLSSIQENRTDRQVAIINAYHDSNGTQVDTAKMLRIHQSSVQRALAAANYYTYRDALDTVASILSEIKEDANV